MAPIISYKEIILKGIHRSIRFLKKIIRGDRIAGISRRITINVDQKMKESSSLPLYHDALDRMLSAVWATISFSRNRQRNIETKRYMMMINRVTNSLQWPISNNSFYKKKMILSSVDKWQIKKHEITAYKSGIKCPTMFKKKPKKLIPTLVRGSKSKWAHNKKKFWRMILKSSYHANSTHLQKMFSNKFAQDKKSKKEKPKNGRYWMNRKKAVT